MNRMPLPPPPAAALSSTGYPIWSARARASFASAMSLLMPGAIGTCASMAMRRAEVFSPRARCTDAGGPTKMMPASAHAWANCAFSERKPYPG
jgi:hypothetical protein